MRVFLAGATGAVGQRLVPRLIDEGHEVVAMTRTAAKADGLRAAGALPVVADALDREAVLGAVVGAQPDVIVHQMTALTGVTDMRHFDRVFATTNRLRTEGTAHLLEAARAAGTRRMIAQSFTGWPFARTGGPVKDEDAPLDPEPPRAQRETLAAIRELEAMVTGAGPDVEGVVLRYGGLYGPRTSLAADGEMTALVRRRRLLVVGDGDGLWSFTHIDDAAGGVLATLAPGGPTGVFAIVDDEPARTAEWIPGLASAIGAPAPRRVPAWVGRLAAGEAVATMMTTSRAASNAKARRELGWTPRYATWREGFRHAL
ncbi:MAG TPA: NAD(P)-dependent oxidoreductase [Baekduia sp.]|uniref:NAD-dependent epimerase/dehydratase family protein n=1 Tax=Baekduia sp. TaxID=2600305 RepID=UPI002BA62CE1|nr:NAD(P)-dependent oxidoreductase [Baekduia sp.]HMJ34590.1 NAD(P)-dependent oxidoreductase [Baekduia sp.]